MTDGAGTQTSSYDNANRLTGVTRGTDSFSYAYDLAGNITSRTYPGASAVTYSYDNDERLSSLTASGNTTGYGYDAAGNVTTTTLPSGNGYVETRVYDRTGRLTEVRSANATSTLSDFSSTLDPVGNPTTITRAGSISETATYGYDANDRLTSVCYQTSCPNSNDPYIRWTYDQVGNRLTETRPTNTTNYTYNAADEMTAAGSTTYTYDQNGNQTAAGADTFTYDLVNRLATSTANSVTTTYSYDGDGNRVRASSGASPSQTTNYLWDTSAALPQLALERDGNNSLLRRYTFGTRRLTMTTGGADFYYHYDTIGSVTNVTSSTGSSEWTYSYEPFGATRTAIQSDPSAPTNLLQFAGELADATGQYYLRARQYDSATGRFLGLDVLSPDPDEPSSSPYAYVADRPTVLIDPTGMTFIPSDEGVESAKNASSPPDYVVLENPPIPIPGPGGGGVVVPGEKAAVGSLAAVVGAALARCLQKHDLDYCLRTERKERHHIVARRAPAAQFARDKLEGVGIGLEEPVNIVHTPYGLHRHLHSTDYYIAINRRVGLAYASQADGKPKGGTAAGKKRVEWTLGLAAVEILTGAI
jgi:RHS repeat-associated protein